MEDFLKIVKRADLFNRDLRVIMKQTRFKDFFLLIANPLKNFDVTQKFFNTKFDHIDYLKLYWF